MCGISGQLSWDAAPDSDLVARMTRKIQHRGPDGEGLKTVGPVALGHRRLAIIDLSPGGAQPMTDVSEAMWIVFNGEIYNYRELRAELKGLGSRFRSQSDTEVILEAYKQWGVECLARFNGMFALALWDGPARALLLARDRLGKKPLYYHVRPDGGAVTFASELNALCEDPRLDRKINPRALSQFLSLNYTLTSDAILEGVRKLPPGHYAICRRDTPIVETPYWNLADHFQQRASYRSEAEAAEALRALMDDSVRARLVSDVPLGVFLSGGIDSSTLAASMCQALAPPEVRSFSMGFQEKSFSEVAEARATAATLGITHRDIETNADVAAVLPRIVCLSDEPFADTSIIPTYLLAEFARRHVTVCLAGDGGDEVFAGYETYVADKLHHMLQWLPSPIARGTAAASALLPVSFNKVSFDYKLRQFLSGQGMTPARAHYHWRTIFSKAEQEALLVPEVWKRVSPHDPFEEFEKFDRQVAEADYLSRGLYVDVKTWLVDDILVKADRASMAHGLEVRTPFLDYRVVEFAASLPIEWKLKGFKKKHVLKLSQRGRLPDATLDRRKQGFNAPVSHWLLSSFRAEFERLTSEPHGNLELFQAGAVKQLWDDHASGRRDNGHKLLGLINLSLWIQQHAPRLG